MKTSRFTGSQINVILKHAEAGSLVQALCREHGNSKPRSTSGGPISAAWTPR